MQFDPRLALAGFPLLGVAAPADAQTAQLRINIPRLNVAEYHRPYVAIWLEKQGAPARSLSVWYDFKMAKGEGTKWLSDVRSWWRASGRTMKFPADGVTGATRAPGAHTLNFTAGKAPWGNLSPGSYVLSVEAAREVGGREVVRLPFAWPPKPGQTMTVAGKSELGAVTLSFKR